MERPGNDLLQHQVGTAGQLLFDVQVLVPRRKRRPPRPASGTSASVSP